ncbi:helix-turn-helix domain-containing protein [Ureibacillus sp. 179-F W5.1 NHS]
MLPRSQNIIQFEELGLLGNFLSNSNIESIRQTAQNELGKLICEDNKNKDLLYSLYIYLVNGRHLEKTMKDLSLSMGGIQYRIRKIEELTGKNLKDFHTASYLLLLIESLLTLGELTWDH